MNAKGFVLGALLGGLLVWALLERPAFLEDAWESVRKTFAGKDNPAEKALEGVEDLRTEAGKKLRKVMEEAKKP